MDNGASSYRRFFEGDRAAFEEIVKAYGDSLACFAYCFVHDSFAAEDIVAETFAAILLKRKKFEENAKFKTYLFRIARNKCFDYLRAGGKTTPLNDVENLLRVDAESEYFEDERNKELYLALQRLPAQYGDALYLTYIDGFSIEEVCKIMRKNKKQVYNLLTRAKPALKKLLSEEKIYEEL